VTRLLKVMRVENVITDEDMELIHQPIDFMGQNIYNGYYIRMGADGKPEYVDRPAGFCDAEAHCEGFRILVSEGNEDEWRDIEYEQ